MSYAYLEKVFPQFKFSEVYDKSNYNIPPLVPTQNIETPLNPVHPPPSPLPYTAPPPTPTYTTPQPVHLEPYVTVPPLPYNPEIPVHLQRQPQQIRTALSGYREQFLQDTSSSEFLEIVSLIIYGMILLYVLDFIKRM